MTLGPGVQDRVATITIDRPEKLNALDIAHLKDLRAALEAAHSHPDVLVSVLTSSTPKAFSTGADIGVFKQCASAAEAFSYDLARSQGT